ncbi:hypothetical protein [uncultured Tateyamaria sp.]|nr:hypothetical protein [uncultured Tateyamaria sp.]
MAKQADNGPTYLRHGGKIAYVLLTERVFDEVWPDQRRAWAIDELPEHHLQMLMQAHDVAIEDDPDEE